MSKKGFKKRRYYFTDKSVATDTVIAFILGSVSLITEITGIVFSLATAGHTPDVFGTLYICALIFAVEGIFFARQARKSQKGGEKSKRFSTVLCIIAALIPVIFWISGMVG